MASRCFMIKKEESSIYARNGSGRKPDQPSGFRRKKLANPIMISSPPNVQTMAAPEGRSHWKERNNPATPPNRAISQPISDRLVMAMSMNLSIPVSRGRL